jgi:hypothetical protein
MNIVEQNDRFDLRIDNQSFSTLYLAEKTKQNFRFEDTAKEFPSTSEKQYDGEEIKKPIERAKEEKKPTQKQANLLDVFDEPITNEVKEEPKPRVDNPKPNKAPIDLFDLEFDQVEQKNEKGVPSFGSSKGSFGLNKVGEGKKEDFFSSEFQF